MCINIVVAVTDIGWYQYLKNLQAVQGQLELVNFWSRTPRSFRALQAGELFLFKPKISARRGFSEHMIVGGGIFRHASDMPLASAWQYFGTANGAACQDELKRTIASGRKNPMINCRILQQPFFLDAQHFLQLPDWSSSIQTYKTYHTDEPVGEKLWNAIMECWQPADAASPADIAEKPGGDYGAPHRIKSRLGQQGFRIAVLENYQHRCIVTRERTVPALEAAHIRPYSKEGRHELGNGLLLRSDIHKLFDAGYVTVAPQRSGFRFVVSQRIKEHYENGRDYYALNDRLLAIPKMAIPPTKKALVWHSEHCYLG